MKNWRKRSWLGVVGFFLFACANDFQASSNSGEWLSTDLTTQAHEMDGRLVRNPYPVDAKTQSELFQTFAQTVQPILEGTSPFSTPENNCLGCHVAGRSGMVGFKPASKKNSGEDANTQFNYWQLLLKGNLNFQETPGSRILAVLRGQEGSTSDHDEIPGVFHMNKDFVVGRGAIYGAVEAWLEKERLARTPGKGLGLYWARNGGFTNLCWIAREKSDFDFSTSRTGGISPRIFCQSLGADHQLKGKMVDLTTLLHPQLSARYDLERLVANYAEDETFKLYAAMRDLTNPADHFNIIEISLEINGQEITGATWRYVLQDKYLNRGEVKVRVDEMGNTFQRVANDYPTDVYQGKVLFYSGRGIANVPEERRNPEHPSSENPHQPNEAIGWSEKVGWSEPYHGLTQVEQVFYADAQGVPRRLVYHNEMFTRNATVGFNGQIFTAAWFNFVDSRAWIQQFAPDLQNGVSDLLPPWINKSKGSLAEGIRWHKMAHSSLGMLLIPQGVGSVFQGSVLESTQHDLGALLDFSGTSIEDQAPPVRALRATGTYVGKCDPNNSRSEDRYVFQGLDQYPIVSLNGATFYIVSTDEFYDNCARTPLHRMGIWHVNHKGDREPIMNVLPPVPAFAQGYVVDSIALLAKKQIPPEYLPVVVEDPKKATIHIPNVCTHLMMRDLSAQGKDKVFDRFCGDNSNDKIWGVRVLRQEAIPLGHVDTGQIHVARGASSHPGAGGSEFPNSFRLLAEIPLKADHSVSWTMPSQVGYLVQFLTRYQTSRGPLLVAVIQDAQIRVSQPGMNTWPAPLNMDHYDFSCARCHGARSSQNLPSGLMEHLNRNLGNTREFNFVTQALVDPPVDLYTHPTGPYMDYLTLLKPSLEKYNCTHCHGKEPTAYGNDVAPPGGLSFEASWANTSDPLVSSRWTNPYPQFPAGTNSTLSHLPMGPQAPYEPGYVMLQRLGNDVASNPVRKAMLYFGPGLYLHRGPTAQAYPSHQSRCGLLLYVLGYDVNFNGSCQSWVRDFDGSPYFRPEETQGLLLDPVTRLPFRHDQTINLEEAQNILRFIDAGIDYRMDHRTPAADYSPFSGEAFFDLNAFMLPP